jgi:hypothetical protein
MILPSLAPAQWAGAFFVRSIFASPASPLSFNIDELRDLNVFNSVQFSFSTLTASGGGEGGYPFFRFLFFAMQTLTDSLLRAAPSQ